MSTYERTTINETTVICQRVGQEFAEIARAHMSVVRNQISRDPALIEPRKQEAIENQQQSAAWYADARHAYENGRMRELV